MKPTLNNIHLVLDVIKSSDCFDELNAQSPTYVYVHLRNDNNELFYVGIGIGNRHMESGCTKRNRVWNDIVKDANGFKPIIVQKNVSRECAAYIETQLIEAFGRKNIGTGPLANLTDGGEGMPGYKFTKDQREKCKNAAVSKYKSSQERDKMSQAATRAYKNPEKKKRHLQACRTPERRKKLSKNSIKAWSGNSDRKKKAS